MAANNPKSAHSFARFLGISIAEGWTESREKFGLAVDITLALAAIGILLLTWYSKHHSGFNEESWEGWMNYWLAVIPVGMWVVWFIYHVLKASHNMYLEIWGRLVKYENIQPLQVRILPPEKLVGNVHACDLSIHNPNQPINGIAIRILSISPPLRHHQGNLTTENCDLDCIQFQFRQNFNGVLQRNQSGEMRLFTVERYTERKSLKFENWASRWNNDFNFQEQEYTLTLEVASTGPDTEQKQFRFLFCGDLQKPPFVVEKIQEITPLKDEGTIQKTVTSKLKFTRFIPATAALLVLVFGILYVVNRPAMTDITIPDSELKQPFIIPQKQQTKGES